MQINGISIAHDNMRDVFVSQKHLGDKPLLICEGETLTYSDADEQSNRIASTLVTYGVKKGDVVATFLYNSTDHATVFLACIKLGAIFASLNISLAPNELVYSMDDTKAKVIFIDNDLLDKYNVARKDFKTIPIEILWRGTSPHPQFIDFSSLLNGANSLPDVHLTPNDPMSIIYTGGSTGMPKGVLAPHLHYIGAAERYKEITQSKPDDVHFANSHFFHVGGQQFGFTGPMYCGTTGVMARWFSVSKYWNIAKKNRATIIDPVGTMISALLSTDANEHDKDHQIRVGIGIASGQVRSTFRTQFEIRFGIPLLEVYAMTELGVLLCSERLNDKTEGTCGKTYGWAEIAIADDNDCPVETGQTGQILLRPAGTNCFMLEYLNKPKETVAAWKNLWYHSGDIGYLDGDGYLHFVGRQAHWVRVRGENVSAFEVEQVLSEHPTIVDCAIVGTPSQLGEEDIVAFIQTVDDSIIDFEDLVLWCSERLAYFKVPKYFQVIKDFPRTITKNEIERHALKTLDIENAWVRPQIKKKGS